MFVKDVFNKPTLSGIVFFIDVKSFITCPTLISGYYLRLLQLLT
jgi:hypothetical protein